MFSQAFSLSSIKFWLFYWCTVLTQLLYCTEHGYPCQTECTISLMHSLCAPYWPYCFVFMDCLMNLKFGRVWWIFTYFQLMSISSNLTFYTCSFDQCFLLSLEKSIESQMASRWFCYLSGPHIFLYFRCENVQKWSHEEQSFLMRTCPHLQ